MPVDTIETRQKLRDGRSWNRNGRVDVAAFAPRPEPRPIVASPARWHVLHTRARQEKALAKTLLAAGIEHYLPLVGRVSYRGRRKYIVQQPLFASYLFMHGSVEATYFAVATKRVANAIRVSDQQRFVQELQQIRLALENRAELSPSRYLEFGRPLLVMPRRGGFGETRNDHQVATAARLAEAGYASVAMNEDELIGQLASLDQVAASSAIASHASVELLSAVRDFISGDAPPSRDSGVQSHPFPAVGEELAHAKAA